MMITEKKIADISAYEGKINWDLAREELCFVIFRASIGMSKDTRYVNYANTCGLPFGVYHFVKASNEEEARQEAKWFYECANAPQYKPRIYFIDIEHENQTKDNVKAICKAFVEELTALGCSRIGLYIGQGRYPWIKSILNIFAALWIPRYGKNTGDIPPEQYYPIYACDLWQYTSEGTVAGINEGVDLNVLYGDKDLEWFINEPKPIATSPEVDDWVSRAVSNFFKTIWHLLVRFFSRGDDK